MVKDYLGNEFETKHDMCKFYGVSSSTFNGRIARGKSLKDALSAKNMRGNPILTDHDGNSFSSQNEMCKFWNIKPTTFCRRIHQGWSLKDALTTTVESTSKEVTDHLGNKYKNKSEMCKAYKIDRATVNKYLRDGRSLEYSLTSKKRMDNFDGIHCKDHLGNKFNSIKSMCDKWGIPNDTYNFRIKNGWSIEDALTKKPEFRKHSVSGWIVQKMVYKDGCKEFYLCTKGNAEEILSLEEIKILKEK